MINKHFSRGVSATALMLALASMPASAQEALPAIDVGAAQPQPATAAPAPVAAPGFSPERQKLPIYRDPPGQTVTTVDTKMFENESVTTVGDLLDYSPGVTLYQGNSVRDMVISIRGAGARSSTGLANIVVLEDGFSLTPANGGGTSVATTNSMDPHSYGAVDVYRGGSSALFGNYAMEGAVNFRQRTGAQIDGAEVGSEYGSFSTLQNWLIAGKKVGDFDISLFASDVRSNSYILHNGFETQTFNVLGTWSPTPTDRVVLKVIQNDMLAQMSGRENWTMFNLNTFQKGYGCAYLTTLNAPFCYSAGTVPGNGILTKAPAYPGYAQSASEIGMHRHNTRDVVGLRYEHDFDNQTTWRTQAIWDLLDVEQPNQPTQQVRGPTVATDFQSDITSHAPIFGYQATHFLNVFYNNAHFTNNAYSTVPFNFNWGAIGALQTAQSNFQSDMGLKAREEIAFSKQLTGVVGFSSTWTKIYGFSDSINYTSPVLQSQPKLISAAHAYWNYAPEATLTYRYSPEWQIRARYETAYAAPAASALFTDSTGNPGDNTSLKAQTSQGADLGVDWTPAGQHFTGSVTIYNEWWRNQFLSMLAPNLVSYSSNIPSSIHRGVEANFEWKPYDGWRLVGNYSYTDQFFTDLTDTLSAFGKVVGVQRAGDKLPAVPKHQFTGRIGYDQPYGDFKGLGGFIEYQYRSDYPIDNANIAWAPGYGIFNLDIHYNHDIENSYLKKFTIYFDVKNIFNRTYFASGAVISDSILTGTLLQAPSVNLLSQLTDIPGSPRAFSVGMKFKF